MLRKTRKVPSGRSRFAAIAAVSGVLVTGVVVGVSSAAVPDAGTATFHGCENKATGVLRLIDPALSGNLGRCIATPGVLQELAVTWNQAGPQGPPGAKGSDERSRRGRSLRAARCGRPDWSARAARTQRRHRRSRTGRTIWITQLFGNELRIKAALPDFAVTARCVPLGMTLSYSSGWNRNLHIGHLRLGTDPFTIRVSVASPREAPLTVTLTTDRPDLLSVPPTVTIDPAFVEPSAGCPSPDRRTVFEVVGLPQDTPIPPVALPLPVAHITATAGGGAVAAAQVVRDNSSDREHLSVVRRTPTVPSHGPCRVTRNHP